MPIPAKRGTFSSKPLHLTHHLLESAFEFFHFLLRAHCDTHPAADSGKAPAYHDALGQHSWYDILHVTPDVDQHEIPLRRNKPEASLIQPGTDLSANPVAARSPFLDKRIAELYSGHGGPRGQNADHIISERLHSPHQ